MGYKSERNRGLTSLAALQEEPAKLWNGLGNNLGTRFVSGAARGLFNDIPRGLYRMGESIVDDVVNEPLRGIIPGGDEGFWRGEGKEGYPSSIYEDLLKPLGEGFVNTGDLLNATVNPVTWAQSAIDPEARKEHFRELKSQGREVVENPFMFGLEHVGNLSLAGAVLSKPAQLGVATSRGAMTGAQAAKGLRPIAGKGTRSVARHATREAASEGSRLAKGIQFTEDIVGHPYRAGWRKAMGSRPAQLFRNPRDRQTVRAEYMANLGRLGSERGSFDFREGDLRRDWNEAAEEFNRSAGFDSRSAGRKVQARNRLLEIQNDMRSRGMEAPEFSEMSKAANRIDPNKYALTEPDALTTREDFQWFDDDLGNQGDVFVGDTLGHIANELEILGIEKIPGEMGVAEVGYNGRTKVAYQTDKSGKVVAAVEVSPGAGINIAALPEARGTATGKAIGPDLIQRVAEAYPDIDWETALKNTTTSEYGTRLQEKMRQRMASGEINLKPETLAARGNDAVPPLANSLGEVFSRLDEPTMMSRPRRQSASLQDWELSEIADDPMFADPRNIPVGASDEAITFRDMMGELFRGEEGSIANPLTRRDPSQPRPMGLPSVLGNEAGLLKEDFLASPAGARFSAPVREARRLVDQRNMASRTMEGPIGERTLEATGNLRGRGVRGTHQALDARATEAKFLRGIHQLGKRRGSEEYASLRKKLDFGEEQTVTNRLRDVRDVSGGRRAIGANLPADKLVKNIARVFDEASARSKTAEGITDEIGKIVPGVDAEGLSLLALNAIEKMRGLPEGSLLEALGDYIQGDHILLDKNRRAQALLRKNKADTTPVRFRISDEGLSVDINKLSPTEKNLFFEAARQRRITQRFMEEAKLQAPGGAKLFNSRSGSRIGLAADEATQFGVNADYLNDVLGTFDQSLDDFGGNTEAAMAALDELQGEFFDVDIHTIEMGNAPKGMKTRLRKEQKRFEKAQYERTQLLEEIDKTQSKANWTKRDWERHRELKEASKKNLNQVITAAARLGKLRETVATSLEAAPVTARNALLYAREVAPQQIKALEGMLEAGVGDPKAVQSVIDDLKGIPRTLEELNDANTYISYLKDVRNIPAATSVGARGSATRGPALRRRGTGLDSEYIKDLRARLFAQDMDFQRYYIAKSVQDVAKEKGLARTGRQVLTSPEIGFTASELSKMTVGQMQDALTKAGYKAFDPDSLFELRRSAKGDPLEASWVRGDVGEILTQGMKKAGWFEQVVMQGMYDKAMRGWKVAVLPLRVAWQVNNIFGNALLSMFAGQVSPFDYPSLMRASSKAVMEWNQGLARTIDIPLSQRHILELEQTLPTLKGADKTLAQDMLKRGSIKLDNTILTEIANNGMIQGDLAFLNNSQFFKEVQPHQQGILRQSGIVKRPLRNPKNLEELGDVGMGERARQRARNLRATGREFVDYAYHINETIDNMHRTMIYLDQMRQGKGHAEAVSMVNKALGDYNKMSDFERRIVRRVYPFWPWMRHMLEVTTRSFAPDNLGRTVIAAHLVTTFGEANEYEELLPEYARGDMFIGLNENGVPKFVSARGLNPYLDVFDPLTQPNMRGLVRPIAPAIGIGLEQVFGISQLTGRPFSSPVRPADQQVPRPPLREQLFRQIPQLKAGRDIIRDIKGEPLARYGTGEPAIFPGAEEGRSALQTISQQFGLNVRTMDVQQMEAQRKLRLFQEQSDKARQKARERAFALENARSLPNPFGE